MMQCLKSSSKLESSQCTSKLSFVQMTAASWRAASTPAAASWRASGAPAAASRKASSTPAAASWRVASAPASFPSCRQQQQAHQQQQAVNGRRYRSRRMSSECLGSRECFICVCQHGFLTLFKCGEVLFYFRDPENFRIQNMSKLRRFIGWAACVNIIV